VPGRFGYAVALSGSGSYVEACGSNPSGTLNVLTRSMTVAFWIRPDVDYASGTGWAWSFGRKDIWRVGYYGDANFHGLQFDAKDSVSGLWRSAPAPIALYAGRWVHVAATLSRIDDGSFHWSNLSLYVNGDLVGWFAQAPYTVDLPTGATDLYLGYDEASGGRFKGVVDEFRLYNSVPAPESIRGLLWFAGGANTVVIPRGVFFQSKMLESLNGSWDPNSPLAGAGLYVDPNLTPAHLNARVVQMVITKNLTLDQAWKLLDLVLRNKTGSETVFAFAATSEFYTLGFAWEVSKLVANSSVPNTGNYSAPPPPPSLWDQFWNTITGIGAWLWNGLVAVGTFFYNVGKWLWNVGVGLYKGIVENNWTYLQDNVIKPFFDAIFAFINWIAQLVIGFFKAVMSGVLNGIVASLRFVVGGIQGAIQLALQAQAGTAALASAIAEAKAKIIGIVVVLAAIPVILRVAEVLAAAITLGLEWLISKLVSKTVAEFIIQGLLWTALSLSITALFAEVSATATWIGDATAQFFSRVAAGVAVVAGVADTVSTIFKAVFGASAGVARRWVGFAFALLGLILALSSFALGPKGIALIALDFLAAMQAIGGLVIYFTESKKIEQKDLDVLSAFSVIMESLIAYGSAPAVGVEIGIHAAKGDYNG